MIDGNAPTKHPLARYGLWGHPFHGVVSGGVLPLPNGTNKVYPQPGGQTADQYGSARALIVPGVPEVERSPEQQAADTAAGYTWRNVATLSGGRNQLWGQPLNGWIYVDPAGERWLVRFPAGWDNTEHSLSAPLNLTFRLSRFGVMGGEAEDYDYPVSLADWQQSGDPITWYPVDSDDGAAPLTTAKLCLDGLRSDGSAAAIMICKRRTTLAPAPFGERPNVDSCVRHPLGWLELTISGPGRSATLAVSVLRSRAQTLYHEAVNPTFTATQHAYFEGGFTGGARISATYPLEAGFVWSFSPGSNSAELFFVRRLLSMFPRSDGGWDEVALEVDCTCTVFNTASVAGPTTLTGSSAATSNATVSLTVAGVVQAEVALEYSTTGSASLTDEPDGLHGEASWSSTLTVDGDDVGAGSLIEEYPPLPPYPQQPSLGLTSGFLSAVFPNFSTLSEAELDSACFYLGFGDPRNHGFLASSPHRSVDGSAGMAYHRVIDTVRLSSQALCLRVRGFTRPVETYAGLTPDAHYVFSEVVTPFGTRGAHRTTIPYDPYLVTYGSICPHTGEATLFSGSPVCYV